MVQRKNSLVVETEPFGWWASISKVQTARVRGKQVQSLLFLLSEIVVVVHCKEKHGVSWEVAEHRVLFPQDHSQSDVHPEKDEERVYKKKYQLFAIWLESSYRIAFSSIVDLNYLSEKVWKSSKTKHSLAPSLPFCWLSIPVVEVFVSVPHAEPFS